MSHSSRTETILRRAAWVGAWSAVAAAACSGPDGGNEGEPHDAAGTAGTSVSSAGAVSAGGSSGTTSTNTGGASGSGAVNAGGSSGSTGVGGAGTGGASAAGRNSGGSSGSAATTGGSTAAGAGNAANAAGTGPATGGSAGMPGGGTCLVEAWPEADPSAAGPFETVTETNVGPAAGEGEDGGEPVAFTLFRPADLAASGRCHPVITWGNGTGASPSLYGVFLRHLASHGFVVIASDSPNVARGDPPPMVAGVTWILEQNEDPASPLYGRIDTAHVGATGHSQGGLATTTASGDSRITTMAPLCGAGPQRNLRGSAFIFCGEEDTVVTCESTQRAFDALTDQPAMFASYLTADHANWVTFRGTMPSPVEVAVTAWMRVELMGNTALRSWFYGPDCALCTDPAWRILQKNLDE